MANGNEVTTNVHMEYTGIIGLVPQDGACFALVIDASKHEHRHRAYLEVFNRGTKTVIRSGDVGPVEQLIPPYIFDLAGHEIDLDPRPTYAAPPNDWVSGALDQETEYVLRLADGWPPAMPEVGKVRPSLIRDPIKGLAARCKMTRGTLAASYVDPGYKWRFQAPPNGVPKRLTQAVRNLFTVAGGRFTLQLKDGATITELTLAANEDKLIDIVVWNRPVRGMTRGDHEAEARRDHHDHQHVHAEEDELDQHVTIHYDLALHGIAPQHRRPLKKMASKYNGPPLPGHGDDTIWARRPDLGGEMEMMVVRGLNCPPGYWEIEP